MDMYDRIVSRRQIKRSNLDVDELVVRDEHPNNPTGEVLMWCLHPFEETEVNGCKNYLVTVRYNRKDPVQAHNARELVAAAFDKQYLGPVITEPVTGLHGYLAKPPIDPPE